LVYVPVAIAGPSVLAGFIDAPVDLLRVQPTTETFEA